MVRIETIINSITVNISIIFSSILIMYFSILKRIVQHAPINLKEFNKMSMSKKSRIYSGIIFAFACYFLSINGIPIDEWQKVDTRYILIYFVMYYASSISGFICGSVYMAIKSVIILLHGHPILSVPFLNNIILTSCTIIIAYFCTRNKKKTFRNNTLFLIILFIVRAVLIYTYIPFIDEQEYSPNLIAYYLITAGLFIIVHALIKSTTLLINSVITYKLSSQIDNLTLLFNRSALIEHFDTLINRNSGQASENMSILTTCILDLDDFKEINDTYGHAVGDQILTELTELMREHFDTNYIYRYGGDEFVSLFVGNQYQAHTTIDKLQHFIKLVEQHIFLKKTKPLKLSISIGINQVPLLPPLSLQELLEQADKALYLAKGNGRNQLRVYQKK